MSLSTTKRQPYTSKACSECQRRKTKCDEARPCLGCRSREVECRPFDANLDLSSSVKRPRISSQVGDIVAPKRRLKTKGPASESLQGPDEALREELRRLRQDVYRLSNLSNSQTYPRPVPPPENIDQVSEYLYPLEDQVSARIERDIPTPDTIPTDTFNASDLWASPSAIANKVNAIRSSVLCEPFLHESRYARNDKTFTLTLPAPINLRRQIDFFLSDFDDFFPYFRHHCLQKRLSTALHSLSYSERQTTIHVPGEYCTIFAILCNILSIAEIMMANNNTAHLHTGEHWFLQGKRLMEQFEDVIGDSVEVVIYHLLVAGSMMEAEKLRTAASYIVRALQGALSIGLNDKTRWKQEAEDIVDRNCLWWTLYFSEKRIHYRCGIPSFLRPEDINMDEVFPCLGEQTLEESKLRLVQGMISYAKLWTSISSSFLAANASFTGKWSEMQIADAKVDIGYHELPQQLQWDTDKVEQDIENGIAESSIRQKLQVFLWHESLRLIIRQSPVSSAHGDAERRKSRFYICKNIVTAISSYIKHFRCLRPIGYFLTCSLIDCLFYIKEDQAGSLNLSNQRKIQDIFGEVHNLLEALAQSVGAAQRALAALRCALLLSSNWENDLDLSEVTGNSGLTYGNGKEYTGERGRAFADAFSDADMADTFEFFDLVPQ